jgi:hypothetical protein
MHLLCPHHNSHIPLQPIPSLVSLVMTRRFCRLVITKDAKRLSNDSVIPRTSHALRALPRATANRDGDCSCW